MSQFMKVEFGGNSVKFYPLTLLQMQELEEEVKSMSGSAKDEAPLSAARFQKLLRAFTVSAKRGDPLITDAQVAAVVDTSNVADLIRTVLGIPPPADKDGAQESDPMRP